MKHDVPPLLAALARLVVPVWFCGWHSHFPHRDCTVYQMSLVCILPSCYLNSILLLRSESRSLNDIIVMPGKIVGPEQITKLFNISRRISRKGT